jgi:hypothetical protein
VGVVAGGLLFALGFTTTASSICSIIVWRLLCTSGFGCVRLATGRLEYKVYHSHRNNSTCHTLAPILDNELNTYKMMTMIFLRNALQRYETTTETQETGGNKAPGQPSKPHRNEEPISSTNTQGHLISQHNREEDR